MISINFLFLVEFKGNPYEIGNFKILAVTEYKKEVSLENCTLKVS